jgi:uncharacterized protein YutE (UPF0331/DUF86 family)
MPIDKLLVKQRLTFIKQYVVELEKLSQLPKLEFLEKRNSAAAESFLRRSLEAIFDTGRHILAKQGFVNMALEYKGIAEGLRVNKIISEELAEKLTKMAGYRNRLVHLYHQVSDEELYEIVKNNLADIKQFKEQIAKYMEE